jgi:hypothetical protein
LYEILFLFIKRLCFEKFPNFSQEYTGHFEKFSEISLRERFSDLHWTGSRRVYKLVLL